MPPEQFFLRQPLKTRGNDFRAIMIGLVLAGGSGTRLWPLSRSLYAKQFISFNSDHSLLQDTVSKAQRHLDEVYVVTGESQYFLVKNQLEALGVKEENIVKEPVGRNTAPAITLGCKTIEKYHGPSEVLVMPSDHLLSEDFFILAKKAREEGKGHICTFGVRPTYPSTGYGYIELGEKLDGGHRVEGFFEKPDEKTAREYISKGNFLWNSGIFLFNTEVFFKELEEYSPEIFNKAQDIEALLHDYDSLENISIDYALMEKTSNLSVFPFEKGWMDLGSWKSVYEILEKDGSGNAMKGDVLSFETEGSLIYGQDRLVTVLGLRNMLVVDTKDALLVADKDRAEDVKGIVDLLRKTGRPEAEIHQRVYRPWGHYTLLESGHRYKVKRISVYPGKRLSLQLHHHRAEHWIVVKGAARITKDSQVLLIHENESIYVPKSTRHRLENPGKVDLELIEIQTGEYVEEDDIIRMDDEYGRS